MLELARVAVVTLVPGAMVQAARTGRSGVSGFGDEAKPCSHTQPCKPDAGAIAGSLGAGNGMIITNGNGELRKKFSFSFAYLFPVGSSAMTTSG